MKSNQIPFRIVWFVSKTIDIFLYIPWSFFVNCMYWIFMRGRIYKWERANIIIEDRKSLIARVPNPLGEIRGFLKEIVWTKDTFLDWKSWLHTMIDKDFRGDCEDIALYGELLFSCAGEKSKLVKLISTYDGTWKFWEWYFHQICITDDHRWFTSNNDMVYIKNRENWKEEIFKYFRDNELQFYDWII